MISIRDQLYVCWERKYHEITQYAKSLANTNYQNLIKKMPITTAKFDAASYSTLGLWQSFDMGAQVSETFPKKQWEKSYDVKNTGVGKGWRIPVYERDLNFQENGSVTLKNPTAMKDMIAAHGINKENTIDKAVYDYILANPTCPDGVALLSASHYTSEAKTATFSNLLTTALSSGIADALKAALQTVDAFVDANGIPIVNRRTYFNTISVGPKWYDDVCAVVQTEFGASGTAGEENIKNANIYNKFKVLNVPYYTGTYDDYYQITADPKPGISSFELVSWDNDKFDVEQVPGVSEEKRYDFKGYMFNDIGCRDALWIVGYIG